MFRKKAVKFSTSHTYWENRYKNKGNSGAGSYQNLAKFKAQVINEFVKKNGVQKVVEFGSGDGNQLKYFDFSQYTGYDTSQKAIEMCRDIYRNDATKEFHELPQGLLQNAELVLSLDVIYHLVENDVFWFYMKTLFECSTRFVIIYSSNYEKIENSAPHVRHREFTKWVTNHINNFKLITYIPNIYPYNKRKPRKTSFADFYIYERMAG